MTGFDTTFAEADALRRELADITRDTAGFSGSFAEEMKKIRGELRATGGEAKSLSTTLGGSLRSAFDKLVFGGGKVSDVLRQIGRDVSGNVFNSALKPVTKSLGAGLSGALNTGLSSVFSGLFADGAAFSAGRVRAFANGGVVSGATAFPMRGGVGLMGEAGPEAIMPLTRGPDGKLGVRSRGGAGGAQVTVNITTPDVQGFQRSRSQVAAQLARAVRFGQRNM